MIISQQAINTATFYQIHNLLQSWQQLINPFPSAQVTATFCQSYHNCQQRMKDEEINYA